MEVVITNENFESYKNGDLPLVVDFWATWCGPCRMVSPIISELANDYDGKIVVGKCNVDENDDIPVQFGIRSIPTILFFKNGELVDKFVGAAKGRSRREVQGSPVITWNSKGHGERKRLPCPFLYRPGVKFLLMEFMQ